MNLSDLTDFSINGEVVDRVKTYTYLGIKLGEQLTLETQANALITKGPSSQKG